VLNAEQQTLKPGMSVSMTVPVAKASDALSVPVTAVFREQKQNVVYVRKAGAVERREVQLGISDLGFAEIRSGLEEGEEILLYQPSGTPDAS
jgi:multidrug efflux pump subunit AcrA (membrane-fusion protein)